MLPTILTILAGMTAALAVLAAIFVIGMRRKARVVQGPLRTLLRLVLNPRQLRQAGQPGATTSIVRYRGRRSGRLLETPVDIIRHGDDFFIALPYGQRTQWLRNVLAAGSAELITDGETIPVDRPDLLVMSTAAHHFPAFDQRAFRLFGTTDCLRLTRVGVGANEARVDAARVDAARGVSGVAA